MVPFYKYCHILSFIKVNVYVLYYLSINYHVAKCLWPNLFGISWQSWGQKFSWIDFCQWVCQMAQYYYMVPNFEHDTLSCLSHSPRCSAGYARLLFSSFPNETLSNSVINLMWQLFFRWSGRIAVATLFLSLVPAIVSGCKVVSWNHRVFLVLCKFCGSCIRLERKGLFPQGYTRLDLTQIVFCGGNTVPKF